MQAESSAGPSAEERERHRIGERLSHPELLGALGYARHPNTIATLLDQAIAPSEGEDTAPTPFVSRGKLQEFDSWLSMRGEFSEVLAAFREAFGTDSSSSSDRRGDRG